MSEDRISYVEDKSGDEFLDVTFYRTIHNDVETDFIKIVVPGDATFTIDTVASDEYKRRFARRWAAYEGMQMQDGTPVREWTDIPESLKNEFIHQGFRHIEQIAGAPDSAFTRIMGGVQWKRKAQDFLNRGKVAESDIIKLQAEQIKQLQEQMEMLLDKKGPGRPAKAA